MFWGDILNFKSVKNCKNFKSLEALDAMHNKPCKTSCSNCIYFSSKNCHMEASNDIEPEFDFLGY